MWERSLNDANVLNLSIIFFFFDSIKFGSQLTDSVELPDGLFAL